MEKQIFKVGDTVYCFQFGEGKVIEALDEIFSYPVRVQFAHGEESFTFDGKYLDRAPFPTLSLTPYTLQGFSQERPINYNDYIGKWGNFYDVPDSDRAFISRLQAYNHGEQFKFGAKVGGDFKHFQPISDEAAEILKKEGVIKE